jgi:DNA repair exonuclease SbcCD ATPase subunit
MIKMTDIKTLQDMLTGLESKKTQLQADESVFLKVSGINEEIEKAIQDKSEHIEELESAKDFLKVLKKKKSDAVSKTTTKIERKMNSLLPSGQSVFTYDEDDNGKRDLHIGWNHNKRTTPYNGLSGGEKQIFDTALADLLEADIIVVEAAEIDQDNLQPTLEALSKLDKQVIVNTWYPVDLAPESFKIIKI